MEQDEVGRTLRSCLISQKGGIKLDNLRKDYYTITGESLPYKKFGFSSVEAFIRNIPEIVVINKNGELYVKAVPSKSTAHLTKLISRQVSRRKIRRRPTQAKKWSPPRNLARSYSTGFKNNESQYMKNNHEDSSNSFSRSIPEKSNLYTNFCRPMPLMETIVQPPKICSNEKSRFTFDALQSPSKKLKNIQKATNSTVVNQSLNKSKTTEELRSEVLIDKTVSPVIISKPKTAQLKSSKLTERLKVTEVSSPINSRNNGHVPAQITSEVSQIASINISDPREELKVRANTLELPSPMYKMYLKKEKDPAKMTIYASVKVGTHTFHTFPEDARSEEEAEKIAARLALVHIAKDLSNPEITTADKKLIKERILALITKHHSGVFMHQLPVYYSEQYGEALPHDWQKIIEKCPEINQEKGVANSTILCRSIPSLKRAQVSSPFKDVLENNSPGNEKVQLIPIGPAAPDKLKVPEATFWNVYTTCVINTIEIWVRIVEDDCNNNFSEMMNEMTEYYNNQIKETAPVSGCVIGGFYAVLEDNRWHRVQCIDLTSDTEDVIVLFIDEGYEEQYKRDTLYPLEKIFCVLPAQAIRVALQGLEDCPDSTQIITEIENHLMDRVFRVKVHGMNFDEDGSYATVTFCDENNMNMNKTLFTKILDIIAASSKVYAGRLVELNVTHMDKQGHVYVQLNSLAKTCLLSLLNSETMSRVPVNVMMSSLVSAIDLTKVYLVQLESQWYRAKVTDVHDEFNITIFLMDIGRTVKTVRGNLLHIDRISQFLQNIPPQAIEIFLHNIAQSMYSEKLVARFNKLVSDTDLLLARVVKVTSSDIPVIEIFKRIGPNNLLASINTSLMYDEELIRLNEDGNNNIKPKKRLERKNSRVLESIAKLNPPVIPDIGQYFDVHVSLAAHPGHFIVQPFNNADNLKTMMFELQKCYNAYEGPQIESVGEGKLYAGKCVDNYWYRVYVTNVINENMISIYFCDFGDVTIVSPDILRPLKSEFLGLPYQAVKAKLVGIQPINTDWSVEDCVRFQQLVLAKNFVSIVVESVFDQCSPANGTVLGLRLIDVSTEKDIFIDKILVEENRAKFIEENAISS